MYDSSKLFSDFCNGPKYAFESFLSHIINLAVFLTLSKTHVQKELQNSWKLNKCSQYFFRHTIQYYKFPCHFNFKSNRHTCILFEVKPCDSALKSKGFYFGAKVILRLDFLSSATDSVRPQTALFCERTLTVAFHICAFVLFSTLIYLQIFTLISI